MPSIIKNIAAGLVLVTLISLIYFHPKDDENIGMLFLLYIALALVLGFLVVVHVVPWFGDFMGNLTYSSNEQGEADVRSQARALLAQGNYEEAIEEFREIAEAEPGNISLVSEIAKTYHEKLHNPQAAVSTYEGALAGSEWSDEDRSFMFFRLADLYTTELKDFTRARGILEQVIQEFPDSRHSANANHKIRDVEQQEFLTKQNQ